MKRLFIIALITHVHFAQSQKATWIWYPGDYELWLHKEVSLRRTERTAYYPTFFRLDPHYGSVNLIKQCDLKEAEEVTVKTTARYNVKVDNNYLPEFTTKFTVPVGKHRISIDMVNYDSLPCLYANGKTIVSDSTWTISCHNNKFFPAASGGFNNINETPLGFRFDFKEILPVRSEIVGNGTLLDFGKELFGYMKFKKITQTGEVKVYYGESREEALSTRACETYDVVNIPKDSTETFTVKASKALRYAYVVPTGNTKISNYSLVSESLPLQTKGKFKCSNERLNKIWDISVYTLGLTTREFMLDGIKRDRWVWSGDATQSFLMNYYLFFDQDVNKRTIIAERGKDPVETHINHIVDYSFYWYISIYDYYMYTGDTKLVKMLYPKMLSMMDFCQTHLDKDHMIVGKPTDWIYLDWAEMDKEGELSAYQILYARSLEAMASCAKIMNDTENFNKYNQQAIAMKAETFKLFWNDRLHALVHNRKNDKQVEYVTRYSNMFALMYGYLDPKQSEDVKKYVLMNDSVQKITTPYMRFYELAALCEIGQHKYVTKEILDYWGAMVDLGATTFWEVYNPKEKGNEHLAMYGRPFGRSLCHAWGASPVYLLGKYYTGVQPLSAGYESWVCEPHLGGLAWIEGSVPTPTGMINVSMTKDLIKIKSSQKGGILKFKSAKAPRSNLGTVASLGNNLYQITLSVLNKGYEVKYVGVE
jgi:alpha-L-rhamnosidase